MNDTAHALFRAVADPKRLEILHLLRGRDLCVGDVVTALQVPQPTASRHLAYLRKIGLITSKKNSYWTFYSLAPAKTRLRRSVLQCLEADVQGRTAAQRRLKEISRTGGCCPL